MQKRRKISLGRRQAILANQDYICGYCFERRATVVDHIVPYSWGQDNTDYNLIGACQTCNLIAGDKVFESLAEKRAYIQRELERPKWQDRTDVDILPALDGQTVPQQNPPPPQDTWQDLGEISARKIEKRIVPDVPIREQLPQVDHKLQGDYEGKMRSVCEALELEPVWSSMSIVAIHLSKIAGKQRPWSGNYMWNALVGQQAVSGVLAKAIDDFLAVHDGLPASGVGKVDKSILADDHTIPPGITPIVLVPAKFCQRPSCPVWFVGWPAQKYCCVECRELDKRGS